MKLSPGILLAAARTALLNHIGAALPPIPAFVELLVERDREILRLRDRLTEERRAVRHAEDRAFHAARRAKRRAKHLRERDVANAKLNKRAQAYGMGPALDWLKDELHGLECATRRRRADEVIERDERARAFSQGLASGKAVVHGPGGTRTFDTHEEAMAFALASHRVPAPNQVVGVDPARGEDERRAHAARQRARS